MVYRSIDNYNRENHLVIALEVLFWKLGSCSVDSINAILYVFNRVEINEWVCKKNRKYNNNEKKKKHFDYLVDGSNNGDDKSIFFGLIYEIFNLMDSFVVVLHST